MDTEKEKIRLSNYLLTQFSKCVKGDVGLVSFYYSKEDPEYLINGILIRTRRWVLLGHLHDIQRVLKEEEIDSLAIILATLGGQVMERFDTGQWDETLGCDITLALEKDTPISLESVEIRYMVTELDSETIDIDDEDEAVLFTDLFGYIPAEEPSMSTRVINL